jgi:hypothetical protein
VAGRSDVCFAWGRSFPRVGVCAGACGEVLWFRRQVAGLTNLSSSLCRPTNLFLCWVCTRVCWVRARVCWVRACSVCSLSFPRSRSASSRVLSSITAKVKRCSPRTTSKLTCEASVRRHCGVAYCLPGRPIFLSASELVSVRCAAWECTCPRMLLHLGSDRLVLTCEPRTTVRFQADRRRSVCNAEGGGWKLEPVLVRGRYQLHAAFPGGKHEFLCCTRCEGRWATRPTSNVQRPTSNVQRAIAHVYFTHMQTPTPPTQHTMLFFFMGHTLYAR